MKRIRPPNEQRHFAARGFTLVELVVVLTLLALLALIAAPALSRTQPNAEANQCRGNLRALITAWQMYAPDNNDRMVTAVHGGAAAGGFGDSTYGVGWASGWLDWSAASDNTNVALLVNIKYAKLASYVSQARTYKCPSDRYLSAVQEARGWTQRARSYSGDAYLGEGNWSTGPTDPLYKQLTKMSQFQYPPPTLAWVFTEEHPDSINDPAFYSPHPLSWIDLPSVLHRGATPFAFADGHVDMRGWETSMTLGRVMSVRYYDTGPGPAAPSGDSDLHWISLRTPRNTSTSY